MNRKNALEALALKRSAWTPAGYKNIGDYHDGIYECNFVSPYTKSAHNIDSPILVILQDWISDDVLSGPPIAEAVELGRIPTLPTNRNLDRLLLTHFELKLSETNLFPFVKPGGMSGNIPFSMLKQAAHDFAFPQIEILKPRLVIAFGLNCFNALAVESHRPRCKTIAEAIDSPFDIDNSKIWCQAHPGALGQNGRNRVQPGQTDLDWKVMANWLHGVI